jgi:hypothetical protein
MSERQLRKFETQVLGPEHAAEHARMRKAIRTGRVRASEVGPHAAAAAPANPATDGKWTSHFSIPVIGINAVMLPTGRVLWFAYPKNPKGNPNPSNVAQAWLWDPAKGQGPAAFKRVNPPLWTDPRDGKRKRANIWCSGNALLSDGRVVVAGGNLAYATATSNYKGLNKLYTFNPWSETWTEQPDMGHGRWYPSQVLMPDGRMVIMSGFDENGGKNKEVEVFSPSPDLNGRGTLTKLGDRDSPGAPPDGGLYPHLFWMPSGRIMVAGPEVEDSWFLHSPIGHSPFVLNSSSWDDIPSPATRVFGSGVLLPGTFAGSSRVELVGGSDPVRDSAGNITNATPKNTTQVFDEAGPSAWHAGASMQVARSHLNTVLLPDSSMVSVGGGIGSVDRDQYVVSGDERQVDLFDPVTGSWHLGAAQAEARAYHSTALLLPDATVASAGDDFNGAGGPGTGLDSDTAEIYEPPYLFNPDGSHAARPSITSAPVWTTWGDSFHVGTPDGNITKAVLVAPGATTHANDMSQRVVPVAVQNEAGGVRITAPPAPNGSADVALPGYYMLFLLNDKGVPSVARWISLSWSDVPPRTAPVWPQPDGGGSSGLGGVLGTAKSGDTRGPSISFSGLNARRGILTGRVSDASGVRSLYVALARKGRRCRWWSRKLGRLSRRGSCRRPAWIRARLRRKGKSFVWKVTLRGRVPRGHYVVQLRAVDGRGNQTKRVGGSAVRISVRG